MSGSDDNTVKVWSVESGECVTTLEGHSSLVRSVSFSPDGQWIASGSKDKTVKVWSVESGECVFSGRHLDKVWRVVFRNTANPPTEHFDDAHTIGMFDERQDKIFEPECYLSQWKEGCLLVVVDGPRIHFLERRPVA